MARGGTFDAAVDTQVRVRAFEWLATQVEIHGDVIPRQILEEGFEFQGRRVPLMSPQGIFKPAVLSIAPLSISTTPDSPYSDRYEGDRLLYSYRKTGPDHPDNAGLRFALQRRLPLVYLNGVVPGKYLAIWPAFIIEDRRSEQLFGVTFDDTAHIGLTNVAATGASMAHDGAAEVRREYVTQAVRRRIHQRAFRERVLRAYREQCAFCCLRHAEMLDAAHIIGDTEPEGEPRVQNGLALCKLHHVAFDKFFVGVRPDLVLEVRADIRREKDGPTLVHAIQALHGQKLRAPLKESQRPAVHLLEMKYDRFLKALGSPAQRGR